MTFLCTLKDFHFLETILWDHVSCSRSKTDPSVCIAAPNDQNRKFNPVTSVDLDVTEGHHALRSCFEVSETQIMPICDHYLRLRLTFWATKPSVGTSMKMLNILSLTWFVTSQWPRGQPFFSLDSFSRASRCRLKFWDQFSSFGDQSGGGAKK